jgi:serine/threonine protein phosphatase PrpC
MLPDIPFITIPDNSSTYTNLSGAEVTLCKLRGDGKSQEDDLAAASIPVEYFYLSKLERQTIILNTCSELDKMGIRYEKIGSTFSGTLIFKNLEGVIMLDCFQVGDSPIMLATHEEKETSVRKVMDIHTVNNKKEFDRLMAFKKHTGCKSCFVGRSKAVISDEYATPENVVYYWVKDGYVVTRSIGDHCMRPYGLIFTPEFNFQEISPKNVMDICVFSDGVTDVLSQQNLSELLGKIRRENVAETICVSALKTEAFSKMDNTSAAICRATDLAPHSAVALIVADGHGGKIIANHLIQNFFKVFTKYLNKTLEEKKPQVEENLEYVLFGNQAFFNRTPIRSVDMVDQTKTKALCNLSKSPLSAHP